MEGREWTETSPGRYSRPMDEIEDAYATIAAGGLPLNREHWAITATLKLAFESPDFVAAVKSAWVALRLAYPALASTNEGSQKVYQICSETEKNIWLEETFISNDSSITAAQLFTELRPVPRATLFVLSKSKELVLRTSHDRIDGIGIIMLLNELVHNIAFPVELKLGEEAGNLSPPFKTAASVPAATPEQLAKLDSEMKNWIGNLPSIGLRVQIADQIPSATRTKEATFSPEETAQIVHAAKARNCTVTHVTHAAVILATKAHSEVPDSDSRKYAAFSVFNLRDQCKSPYNSSAHSFSTYHSGWPIVITPGSFDDTTSQLKNFYNSRRNDSDFVPMVAPLFTTLKVFASATKPSSAPPASEPTLSSLGVVQTRLKGEHGDLRVEDFGLALDTLTPQVYVVLWTWKDRMTLRACYNETYHSDESVNRFLSLAKDSLLKGLGI